MDMFEMYRSGVSIADVSIKTQVPPSTVRRRLKKANILRSRHEAMRLASRLGRLGSGLRGKKRSFSKATKVKMSEAAIRRWEGNSKGYSIKPNGYLEITTGTNKGRGAHVVVVEEFLCRKIFANECVHHINGKRTDNRLCNLRVMTRSEHARLHAFERIKKGTNFDINAYMQKRRCV